MSQNLSLERLTTGTSKLKRLTTGRTGFEDDFSYGSFLCTAAAYAMCNLSFRNIVSPIPAIGVGFRTLISFIF